MAVTPNSLPTTQSIQSAAVQILNATGAVGTTLTNAPSNSVLLSSTNGGGNTAGANGSIVKAAMVNSDDTSARVLVLYFSTDAGTTKWPIGCVNIPTLSGQSGTVVTVDLLDGSVLKGFPIDQAGRNVIELPLNARLYVGVQVAVTAAKFINVLVSLEDF